MSATNAPPASNALRHAGSLSGQAGGGGAGALPRPDGLNLDTRGVGCPMPLALIQLIGRAADAEALARQAREPGSRLRVTTNAAWVRTAVVQRLAAAGVDVPAEVGRRLREMDRVAGPPSAAAEGDDLESHTVGCPMPNALWDLIGAAADAAAIARRRDHPGERLRVESNAAWIRGAVVERLARCEVAVPEAVQERLREMDR
ncbi:MAG: hypothetical protein AB1941_15840 [Gemmatimonadota bacterium]